MRLVAQNVCIERAGWRILSNVSFDAGPGALIVTGPNGAGKTSLLRACAGLLPLAAGALQWEGVEEPALAIHFLSHRDGLKAQMSARENLRFAAGFLGGGSTDAIDSSLDRLGLRALAEAPVGWLSAGQRRRVALARLLVAPRPVWILDEPTAALDAQGAALFAELARAHLGSGGMLVAATHTELGVGAKELRLGAAQKAKANEIAARGNCPPPLCTGKLAAAEPSPTAPGSLALFRRELLLAGRAGGGAMGVAFLLTLATLVPFAIGPDLALLARIGPAVLWLGALLATLLGLDRLFQTDAEDGALDLLRFGALPLEAIVLIKAAAHWLLSGAPLALAAPVLGLLFAQEPRSLFGLFVSLLLGTPALACIGAVGAAATVGLRRGGFLLALIVLPLSVPVLIFGAAAAEAARMGSALPALALVAAATLAAGALAPFAAAAALRVSGE